MKIVVADDSKAMRMIVLRNLRQGGFDGATFFEAADGAQALEVINAEKPDLVLSDWNMPEMNGLELCQAVDHDALGVVFGFVTSESTAEMRQLAEEAGAKFLIAKPFTPESFQDVLTDALAAAGKA
jgi:two-component system, chemotaxis family, chemotaxis protein CheY